MPEKSLPLRRQKKVSEPIEPYLSQHQEATPMPYPQEHCVAN